MLSLSFFPLRRLFGVLGAVVIAGMAFAGFGAQRVLAHNNLDNSVPANGAMLTAVPTAWSLTFTKDVPLDSASGEVVAASGVRTPLPAPTYGASQKEILFALPPDLSGAVTARWRLVGTDGHVLTQRVSFTVNTTAAVVVTTPNLTETTEPLGVVSTIPAVIAPETDVTAGATDISAVVSTDVVLTPEPVRIGIRLFGYAGLLLVGGMMLIEKFVTPGVLSAFRSRETLLASGAVLAIAPLIQTLIFLDDSRDFGVLGSLPHILEAFDTTPGSMLVVRTLAGAVLLAGIVRAHALTSSATYASVGVYLIALAYTGHSRSMVWPLLGVPADVIHTAAAAVWLGGLAVFVLFIIPALQPAESFEAFRRFGTMAQYAVIAMVITGVIQTLRLHGSIITLFTENHGRWLLLKLILVASMLKIGDINRRRLLRKLPTDDARLADRVVLLRRASMTEIANGGLVMLVTAVLVTSSFN